MTPKRRTALALGAALLLGCREGQLSQRVTPATDTAMGPAAELLAESASPTQQPAPTVSLAAATAEPVDAGGGVPLPEPVDPEFDLGEVGRLLDSNRYAWTACAFELNVSKHGTVEGFRWLKPEQAAPEARAEIEEIARSWRFKPVLQDGKRIPVYFSLAIDHCPCLARPQPGD